MTWNMIGKPFSTADMSASVPTISQRFRIPTTQSPHLLGELVAGIVLFNDPAFTALTMELWSDRNGSPVRLLATSTTSLAKAAVLTTEDHAYKILGFLFDPQPTLNPGTYYHAVIRASGYTGNSSSHIAWRHSYPDPQHADGVTLEAVNAARFPFDLTFLTAEV
jgi:hypothetical protein